MTKKRILIAALTIAILAGVGLLLYTAYFALSPDFENALRKQFGDQFFDDFNDLPDDLSELENEDDQLENIIEKYEPLFQNLEDTASKRLEDLLQAAVSEYEEQKKTGTFDRFQLTNKYIQAGRLLENRVDDSFYAMLNQMKVELNRKKLPTEIISEIEDAYKETKAQKKQELFSRLREKIGN